MVKIIAPMIRVIQLARLKNIITARVNDVAVNPAIMIFVDDL